MPFDPSLAPSLELLVCPACRQPLAAAPDTSEILCTGCGLRYPVEDNLPVLLIERATLPRN